MENIRPITIAGLFLAILALASLPYDWRVAALFGLLALMVAIRNLTTAD